MHRRIAIVNDQPGVTRDPVEATAILNKKPIHLVDTGGYKLTRDIGTKEAELDEYESKYVPFEETEEYAKLVNDIDELKASLPEIPTNDNNALTNTKKIQKKNSIKIKMN